jgi:hypothetical protein
MRFFRSIIVLSLSAVFVSGCASLPWWASKTPIETGQAMQEASSSWGYYPIEPLPVYFWCKSEDGKYENYKEYVGDVESSEVLEFLPDEAMRIAIGEVKKDGSIAYGPAKAGIKGHTYVMVLDYTKFTVDYLNYYADGSCPSYSELKAADPSKMPRDKMGQPLQVPFYIGVGLRLTANFIVNEGSIDLGNLVALGAAAQAKQVSGTMVVQALGITGPSISLLIPMPNEINATTIQHSLVSLGAIKAKIYEKGTKVTPSVLGLYNTPGGGRETITRLISCVLKNGATLYFKPEKCQRSAKPQPPAKVIKKEE